MAAELRTLLLASHGTAFQVKELRVGQRVGVGWIKDSCRRCRNCLRGEENLCLKGYTGLIVKGEGSC